MTLLNIDIIEEASSVFDKSYWNTGYKRHNYISGDRVNVLIARSTSVSGLKNTLVSRLQFKTGVLVTDNHWESKALRKPCEPADVRCSANPGSLRDKHSEEVKSKKKKAAI